MSKTIDWDNIKSQWSDLTREEQAAVCRYLKTEGISQVKSADMLGITPRLVKSRLSDANSFELAGTLPTDLVYLGLDREAIISSEMDRRDRLVVNRTARSQMTQEVVTNGVLKLIQENLASHSEQLEKTILAAKKEIVKAYTLKNGVRGTEAAIQHISDLHHCRFVPGVVDETVTAAALAKYRDTANELTRRQRAHANVDELYVFVNGDNMHGTENFKSQARESTGSMSYQIYSTARLIIDHINQQRTLYKKIRVVCTGGNHGRKFKGDDLLTENSEFELGRLIQFYYENSPDVSVHVTYGTFYYVQDVLGRQCLVTHGDAITGFDPNAIINSVKRWEDVFPEKFDDAYIGHFHRQMMLPLPTKTTDSRGRWIFLNGTAAKEDDFLITRGSSPSLQWWFNFCNGKRSTATYAVDLYA